MVSHGRRAGALAEAQYNLGVMYTNGESVPQDHAEAAYWLLKATEQEHLWAIHNLGVSYYRGEGVSKDSAEAVRWYQIAASQGHTHSQFNLGLIYHFWRRRP